MIEQNFNEYWKSLDEEDKESLKEIVIARLEQMPNNLRLSLG